MVPDRGNPESHAPLDATMHASVFPADVPTEAGNAGPGAAGRPARATLAYNGYGVRTEHP